MIRAWIAAIVAAVTREILAALAYLATPRSETGAACRRKRERLRKKVAETWRGKQ